jgi:hypothetical protein
MVDVTEGTVDVVSGKDAVQQRKCWYDRKQPEPGLAVSNTDSSWSVHVRGQQSGRRRREQSCLSGR